MYKAIVVDDEKWIVEGIKAEVDWGKYGFEVVGNAENGQEALEAIEILRPNLVLTDIKMPIMNGLELIRKGKSVSPETQFVVLSGHAEFAYAQKALNYGTFGYCLKPFEIEEIHGMLNRLSNFLNTKKKAVSTEGFPELYEAICSGDEKRMNGLLEKSGLPLSPHAPLVPVVVQGFEHPLSVQDAQTIAFPMSRRRYGYLLEQHRLEEFLREFSHAGRSNGLGAGVGRALADASELEAALESASLAAFGVFSTGKPGIYRASNADYSPIDGKLREIAQTLNRKDRLDFVASMESAKAGFLEGLYSIKEAYLLYTSVLYLFPGDGHKANGRLYEGYEQLYYRYGTAEAMIDDLIRTTLDSFSEETEAEIGRISHKKIKEIVLYIREHFNREISLQSLADRFYLSPNYLCQLFKREVGETIVEHISRQRIGYACKLLADTDLSISEIGEKCGFQDYFYFTRIFKRFHQMTPTQYREQA